MVVLGDDGGDVKVSRVQQLGKLVNSGRALSPVRHVHDVRVRPLLRRR